jgi:hypothetical protein
MYSLPQDGIEGDAQLLREILFHICNIKSIELIKLQYKLPMSHSHDNRSIITRSDLLGDGGRDEGSYDCK